MEQVLNEVLEVIREAYTEDGKFRPNGISEEEKGIEAEALSVVIEADVIKPVAVPKVETEDTIVKEEKENEVESENENAAPTLVFPGKKPESPELEDGVETEPENVENIESVEESLNTNEEIVPEFESTANSDILLEQDEKEGISSDSIDENFDVDIDKEANTAILDKGDLPTDSSVDTTGTFEENDTMASDIEESTFEDNVESGLDIMDIEQMFDSNTTDVPEDSTIGNSVVLDEGMSDTFETETVEDIKATETAVEEQDDVESNNTIEGEFNTMVNNSVEMLLESIGISADSLKDITPEQQAALRSLLVKKEDSFDKRQRRVLNKAKENGYDLERYVSPAMSIEEIVFIGEVLEAKVDVSLFKGIKDIGVAKYALQLILRGEFSETVMHVIVRNLLDGVITPSIVNAYIAVIEYNNELRDSKVLVQNLSKFKSSTELRVFTMILLPLFNGDDVRALNEVGCDLFDMQLYIDSATRVATEDYYVAAVDNTYKLVCDA